MTYFRGPAPFDDSRKTNVPVINSELGVTGEFAFTFDKATFVAKTNVDEATKEACLDIAGVTEISEAAWLAFAGL